MQVRGWYAGAATLMLALGALLLARTAERVAVLVFALFCVCMVIGLPPVFGLVSALPGFSTAHNERLLIYVLLSLALLAGWGLDDLSAASIPPAARRAAVLIGSAVIFCVPIVWLLAAGTISLTHLGSGLSVAWGFADPPLPAPGADLVGTATAAIVRDSSLLIWLPVAGLALALIAWRLRPDRGLSSGAFVVGMLVLLSIDLFRANMGFNSAIPIRTASPPVTGAIRYLSSQRPNRFVGVSTAQLSQPLPADLAMTFGLYDARGYDFPVEKRFDALWRGSVAPGVGDFTQPEEFAGATPAALRALNLLSVADLLLGPLQAAQSPLKQPGLSVAYRGSDGVVYHNSNALPRAFLVAAQRRVSGDAAALSAVTAPGFDGRQAAITESPVPGIPTADASAPRTTAGTARLVRYGAQDVEALANARRAALLVLTDSSYPGWEVTVDGRPARLLRVDYLLRGVVLPPGQHRIDFRYSPASWQIGWIISLLALVGLLLTVAIGVRARRARR